MHALPNCAQQSLTHHTNTIEKRHTIKHKPDVMMRNLVAVACQLCWQDASTPAQHSLQKKAVLEQQGLCQCPMDLTDTAQRLVLALCCQAPPPPHGCTRHWQGHETRE
jgi:hypothetical protein